MKNENKLLLLSLVSYFVTLVLYAVFSYSLTAPNLVLSTNDYFWQFQTFMWETFFENRVLLIRSYFALITLMFVSYFGLVTFFFKNKAGQKTKHDNWKKLLFFFLLLALPLFFSSTALSYDVYNYIFNAKMMAVYHVNPHIQVALDFPNDPWLRFMHNTHTSAPYGYGWSLLSLIPFYLGGGKFITTWLAFRLFNFLSLLTLLVVFWHQRKSINKYNLLLFAFNPLILVEFISNIHNDFWMISPAIVGLILINSSEDRRSNKGLKLIFNIVASLSLILISVYIKLASVVLLPIWAMLVIKKYLKEIPRFYSLANNWPVLASIAMFIPLLTIRSQQFHPWYLAWSLAFIPLFMKNKLSEIWAQGLIVLSVSSMFRYLPFLMENNFDGDVIFRQKATTFIPLLLFLAYVALQTARNYKKTS